MNDRKYGKKLQNNVIKFPQIKDKVPISSLQAPIKTLKLEKISQKKNGMGLADLAKINKIEK